MLLTNFIDTTNGPVVLLATIAVVMILNLIFRIGSFAYEILKKKVQVSEETMLANTNAISSLNATMQKIEFRLGNVEGALSDNPKMKTDLRRCFTAMKLLAGAEWNTISKIITDDEYNS